MARNQKLYTPEFKQQIVELCSVGGTLYPQLECEYGVSRSTLSNWVRQLSPIKVSEEETIVLKEYKALRKEIQRLKIENEILKKRPLYSQENNSRNCDFYPEAFKPLHSVPVLQYPEIPQEYLLQGSGPCTLKRVVRV